jgi:hypothetical protein
MKRRPRKRRIRCDGCNDLFHQRDANELRGKIYCRDCWERPQAPWKGEPTKCSPNKIRDEDRDG